MKLLFDQDVYEITAKFLENNGFDVLRVRDIGMAQASDEDNLAKAIELERVFVTRDRDYGHLVFVKNIRSGVLYLRMLPSNSEGVHKELLRVLKIYDVEEIRSAFIVIEDGKHRFRRLS